MWRSARRTFVASLLAEAAGAVGLAGVLLFGRQLATELAADPPVDSLRDVLPEAIGLAVSLLISGLSLVVVRHLRWLVAEQVSRHVQDEIAGIASSVDYERYEQQDFHDLLSRSNSQASESSYQIVYNLLSLFTVLATGVVVLLVLIRTVPEVLPALVLIAVPSLIAARASARLGFRVTYDLTPNDRLRHYLYSALTERTAARELRVFGLSDVLHSRWEKLYDDRMKRISGLVRQAGDLQRAWRCSWERCSSVRSFSSSCRLRSTGASHSEMPPSPSSLSSSSTNQLRTAASASGSASPVEPLPG